MRFLVLMIGACGSLLCGCAGDPYLKVPSLAPRSASAERRASQYHDPFPDDQMGPKTFSRPRDFQVPRTTTRQSSELRSLHMLGPDEAVAPPPSNRADRRYSQVVDPD